MSWRATFAVRRPSCRAWGSNGFTAFTKNRDRCGGATRKPTHCSPGLCSDLSCNMVGHAAANLPTPVQRISRPITGRGVSKHVLVLLGTRPEAIKLFPVVNLLKAEQGAKVTVCATAQHRGLLDQVLKLAKVVPDVDLNIMTPGQTLDDLSTRLLLAIGTTLDELRPDRVVVQGDTTTAMAGALAAFYRRIPVSHVEAGLRSGNI